MAMPSVPRLDLLGTAQHLGHRPGEAVAQVHAQVARVAHVKLERGIDAVEHDAERAPGPPTRARSGARAAPPSAARARRGSISHLVANVLYTRRQRHAGCLGHGHHLGVPRSPTRRRSAHAASRMCSWYSACRASLIFSLLPVLDISARIRQRSQNRHSVKQKRRLLRP